MWKPCPPFHTLGKIIIYDRGTEFVDWKGIEEKLGVMFILPTRTALGRKEPMRISMACVENFILRVENFPGLLLPH